MLRFLLEKEFKQFFRNSFLPRVVVILPFAALLLFPLVADFEIKNINLSVVDNDKSSASSQLVRKVESSGYFRITNISSSYAEALQSVERNRADVVLEIPAGMEKRMVAEGVAYVMISSNTLNGMLGGLSSSYLSTIVRNFNQELAENNSPSNRSQMAQASQSQMAQASQSQMAQASQSQIMQSNVVPTYRFNPRLIYRIYMIPAIMVMMLSIISGFLPALNIVGEKESGTIEQMNVTPVRKIDFILAKLIPYWVAGFVVLTVCFLVAWLMYGFLPSGSFVTIYITSALFVLAMSGFGLVISNYAKTIQQAIFMIFFFVITFIFMSGLYTPIASMPQWAQVMSHASPLRYIISAFRLIYLKGSSGVDLLEPMLALIGFAVFFNGWAVISYRKTS